MKHLCKTLILLVLLSSLNIGIADTGYCEPPEEVKHTFLAEVTAYTASVEECGKDDGITASGVFIEEGHIAMDDSIPFGTRVRIAGLGEYVVTDRGGDITGNRIDIFTPSRSNAFRFGRKVLEAEILAD